MPGDMSENSPGSAAGAGTAGVGTGELAWGCCISNLVSLSMFSSIRSMRSPAAAAAVAGESMVRSGRGEEGARFEVGEAGALVKWSESSSTPNFAILTS